MNENPEPATAPATKTATSWFTRTTRGCFPCGTSTDHLVQHTASLPAAFHCLACRRTDREMIEGPTRAAVSFWDDVLLRRVLPESIFEPIRVAEIALRKASTRDAETTAIIALRAAEARAAAYLAHPCRGALATN